MCYFLLGDFELAGEVLDTIVLLLIGAANDSNKLTMLTLEDDCWALVLVTEQLLVRHNLLTPFIVMATPKLYFAK